MKRKTHKKRGVENKEPIVIEASLMQLVLADSLLETCSLPQKEYEYYYNLLRQDLSSGEVEEITTYLKDYQLDPIDSGRTYNQTDIKKKLREL